MNIVSGTRNNLPAGVYDQLSIYRHQVFVELLGWQLDTPAGIEQDGFDREDTVYVVAKNDNDEIIGCARLLPTTQPYLLKDVFPELLNGLEPPQTKEVWELSRFAAIDLKGSTGTVRAQISSPIAVELLRGALSCAVGLGARRLITVSPLGVERLLRQAGFRAHRAGPPLVLKGHPLFACWIDLALNAKNAAPNLGYSNMHTPVLGSCGTRFEGQAI